MLIGAFDPMLRPIPPFSRVAMMADRAGYTGGVSCFEKGRRLRLERGDVVFFRGEICEHWIEPVETGFRAILQIEMCRMKNGRH